MNQTTRVGCLVLLMKIQWRATLKAPMTNTSGGWRRKLFKAPDSTYKGDVHEASELGELLSPYEYFKGYVPNGVFLELAEKTNRYSVFHEGSSMNTNEAKIRRLVALHLTMGVLHYPRLRLY